MGFVCLKASNKGSIPAFGCGISGSVYSTFIVYTVASK